jgi:outer membrane protein TolC
MHVHLILAIAVSLPAASQAPSGATLTESVFLAGFDGGHVAVRALTEDVARAEAARRRAGTLGNPRVDFEREAPEDNPKQTTWTAAWAPPLDGRLRLAREAAETGLAAARERFAADRVRLRRELRKAYADWVLSTERQDVLQTQRALVDSLAEQVRRRAEVGEESGIGARRLLLASAEIGAELAVAEADAMRAAALARAWRPEIPPDARPVRPPLESPPATAASRPRPELEALRLEVRQAQLEGRLARRFVIFPELSAGWQRLEHAGVEQTGPVFGVSWSLPLFDRSQAARIEAVGRQRALEARLAVATARSRAEVEASGAAYALLAARTREQARAIGETDRLLEGASASFRAGESTVTDLLETLRSVREARLKEIELYAEALEAQRALEAAGGSLPASEEQR